MSILVKDIVGKVHVEFIKAWGHPTKNEVYGPPQRFLVTAWQATQLINGGYAKLVKEIKHGISDSKESG